MHNAPPVVAPVGRFVWGRLIFAALMLAAVLAGLHWLQAALPSADRVLISGVMTVLAWLLAWRSWTQELLTCGQLVWSGEDWCWRSEAQDDTPVQVDCVLDWGGGMLLSLTRMEGPGSAWPRARFASLTRQQIPRVWHGFRCAVYSRPVADPGRNRRVLVEWRMD